MEQPRCAYCGKEISSEPVAPTEGEIPIFREGKCWHLDCWGRVRRERSPILRGVEIPEEPPRPWPLRPEAYRRMTFEEVIKKFKPRPYTT